jgi:hypothetical protein
MGVEGRVSWSKAQVGSISSAEKKLNIWETKHCIAIQ